MKIDSNWFGFPFDFRLSAFSLIIHLIAIYEPGKLLDFSGSHSKVSQVRNQS